MLVLDVKVGDSIRIGDAVVTLVDKSGKVARLSIEASKDVPIKRVQANGAAQFAKNGIGMVPA